MKKLIIACFFWGMSIPAFSQTLFSVANEPVSKDEFLRAYNKNKVPGAANSMSPEEYLELYTRFKMKVRAARDMKLDTLPQLKYDLQNFRSQIQDSYLNDEKGVTRLVEEAFNRMQKELHVMHFYIKIHEKMPAADTVNAYKALEEISDEIEKKGIVDYDGLVARVSRKYHPVRALDLGFITALQIPYEYENVVYGLAIGQANKPYRSKTGLHVFRVLEERKSSGRWKIAQILLAFPPDADPTPYVKNLGRKADSIYAVLQAGGDFIQMAKDHSDDKLTYLTGGEMPEFGVGKYELPFEKKVFDLQKDGDIAQPFFTEFGYHIIKRLKVTPTPTDKNDAAYMFDLKQRVNNDPRINTAREKFLKEVVAVSGIRRNNALSDKDLFRFADSISTNRNALPKNYPIFNTLLFSIEKKKITGGDWLSFIKDYKSNSEIYKGEKNPELLTRYEQFVALEHYKKNLEKYNPDFRYQMQEFKEGNMLFEIMERNVWSAASADNAGLQKYYEANKSNYKWAPSVDALVFNCSSKTAATTILAELKNGKNWSSYSAEVNGTTQADSGRYELAQLPLGNNPPAPGNYSSIIENPDGSAMFFYIVKNYPGNLQRSFEEARGLVINDYQTVVENRWIEQLKKKYPVKINQAIFKTIAP